MILPKVQKSGPVEIDLTGPDGNAFVLLAYAKQFADQLELDSKAILEDMKNGDYENLLNVFDKHFGDYVILYR
jgi:hypothetical protein